MLCQCCQVTVMAAAWQYGVAGFKAATINTTTLAKIGYDPWWSQFTMNGRNA